MLVTPLGGTTTRYDFTSFVVSTSAPDQYCGSDGSLCSCSRCPNYSSNNIKYYQVVTVPFNGGGGEYSITSTSDSQIEQPYCTDFPNVEIDTPYPTTMPTPKTTAKPTDTPIS